MVSVLSSNVEGREFDPRSGQIKNYKTDNCCFPAKHEVLQSKSTDLLSFSLNMHIL